MIARILLIEDNDDLAFGLVRNLEFEGFSVDVAADGRSGLERALLGQHDLIILDLMLPGMNGMSVLRQLRREGVLNPVLILTAKGEEIDKVRGLRSGADDYLTKPFGVLELVARVEALLRRATRASQPAAPTEYRFGEIRVDITARTVERRGSAIQLAPREYALLVALLEREGTAVSRHELLRDVWGHRAAVETRTVDTHIGELRRKLEDDPARPEYILTVRKFGYRLDPGGVAAQAATCVDPRPRPE